MHLSLAFCILVAAGVLVARGDRVERPTVTTPYGKIQGIYETSYKGKTYSHFLGVPYAQPPIGQLRFKEPQPLKPWTGIFSANISTACIQVNHGPEPEGGPLVGDEDCLYINIFVPRKRPSQGDLLDVIVHFHSGAFNFGSGNDYAGPKYLMDINVIFITVNYRLGALGFMSTEDEVLPGNNGMRDQVAALTYVKENIKYFGGNPDSVTITGLSAGGASVHYHFLSPLSKGLFNRGMSISGTALDPWTQQDAALEKAKMIGAHCGCTQESSQEMVECLRQRPARQIVEGVRQLRPWLYNPFSPFAVVAEKAGSKPFLPDNPYVLLAKGKVHDLPWITAVTSDEGLYPGADYMVKDNYLADLERRWTELASAVLDYKYTIPESEHATVAMKAKEYYLKGKPISKETFRDLIQMMSDRLFVVDSERAARLQAKANKSPVYHYYFSYPGEKVSTYASYYALSEEKYGVCHGDDVMYVVSPPRRPITKMTEQDERMKDVLLKLWGSFAKDGVPVVDNVKWQPVSKNMDQPFNYLHIRSPYKITMEKAAELGHRSFWESIPFEENQIIYNKYKDEL